MVCFVKIEVSKKNIIIYGRNEEKETYLREEKKTSLTDLDSLLEKLDGFLLNAGHSVNEDGFVYNGDLYKKTIETTEVKRI